MECWRRREYGLHTRARTVLATRACELVPRREPYEIRADASDDDGVLGVVRDPHGAPGGASEARRPQVSYRTHDRDRIAAIGILDRADEIVVELGAAVVAGRGTDQMAVRVAPRVDRELDGARQRVVVLRRVG